MSFVREFAWCRANALPAIKLLVCIAVLSTVATLGIRRAAGETRSDLYGDPLPEKALVRLGSVRFAVPWDRGVLDCAYTAHSRELVSLCSEGIDFWDPASGEITHSIALPEVTRALNLGPQRYLLALSDPGKSAALLNSLSGNLSLINVSTGDLLARMRGGRVNRWQNGLFFLGDDATVISFGSRGANRIDTRAEEVVDVPRSERLIAVAPDAGLAVGLRGYGIELREMRTGGVLQELGQIIPDDAALSVTLRPEGECLHISSGATNNATPIGGPENYGSLVFDGSNASTCSRVEIPYDETVRIGFEPAGALTLDYGRSDGLRSDALATALPAPGLPKNGRLLLSSDRKYLSWPSCRTRIVHWDLANAREVRPSHGDFVQSIAISNDGARLATVASDCSVRFWDTATGAQVGANYNRLWSGPVSPSLSFSSDGNQVAIASGGKCYLLSWHEAEFLETFRGVPEDVHSVVFSPRTEHLAVGTANSVYVLDMRTRTIVKTLTPAVHQQPTGHEKPATAGTARARRKQRLKGQRVPPGPRRWISLLQFSPDGHSLAMSIHDRAEEALAVWDLASEREQRLDWSPSESIRRLAFSADAQKLAICGSLRENGLVAAIFDVCTGRALVHATPNSGLVHAVALLGNGKVLATAEGDRLGKQPCALRFWDATNGKMIHSIEHPCVASAGVAWSADGARVAAACNDGSVLIFETPKEAKQ